MQVDWITVVAQIANFLVLVWLLRRFLYGPITRAMARREERIAERLAEAGAARAEAEAEAERLRQRERALEAEREAVLDRARIEAEALRQRLEQEIRAEAEDRRRAWREAAAEERADFAKTLQTEAAREIVAIVRRVLADFANADLAATLADEFAHRIAALGEPERARLAEAARDAEAPALIESATALPSPVRGQITRALHENVLKDMEVEYRTSDDLVLGIRLTVGGQTVEWSASGHLARLETALNEAFENAAAQAAEAG